SRAFIGAQGPLIPVEDGAAAARWGLTARCDQGHAGSCTGEETPDGGCVVRVWSGVVVICVCEQHREYDHRDDRKRDRPLLLTRSLPCFDTLCAQKYPSREDERSNHAGQK